MKLHPVFRAFAPGQRVRVTGQTSYNRKVKEAPGTILTIGNSMTIELDESMEPYYSKQDLCYTIPPKQLVSISIGDLKAGFKEVRKI